MTEKEHQRIIKHRLAVIRHADEVTGNVAATCRYFGISRQCFYTWLRRFEEEGEEGLRERSRRPLTSPRATQSEVVGKIIYLRKNYHFGPQKISMYLKRYEKPLPGHRVQVDVKFIEPIAGLKKRHCQYTAVDDCTRIRVLRIYPKNDQRTATQFLYYLLERLPFKVEVIQTDNGAEFQGSFHYHVLDKGVGHVYIKPASPRLNGKEVVTRTEFP